MVMLKFWKLCNIMQSHELNLFYFYPCRELLWKLLTSCNTEFKDTQILEEACQVIMVGLPVLYPSNTDKSQLLQTLLFDGKIKRTNIREPA